MRVITTFLMMAAMCFPAAAAAGPGDAALEFLEKVRRQALDLEPGADTALSSHVTPSKRREIANRLNRMARDLEGGEYEIGPVRTDGDYAAVIVRKSGGFDPAGLRVFPLAVLRRGGEWLAAPVPASFENTGADRTLELRKRLEQLELWMLREQNKDLERLRNSALEKMRGEIEARITAEELARMSVAELGAAFIEACEARDVVRILGMMGGLSAELPDDWTARSRAVEGLRGRTAGGIRAWWLLAAPEVLRVMVHHETHSDEGLFSIACMDPSMAANQAARARVEFLHLALERDRGGLWRVDPPPPFYEDEPTDGEAGEDEFDSDLLEAFPSALRGRYPVAPAPTADEALARLCAAMGKRTVHAPLVLTEMPGHDATGAVAAASRFWWTLNEPGGARHLLPLAFREEGGEAAAVCQVFSAREPDRADLRVLRFIKGGDGWLWRPAYGKAAHGDTANAVLEKWIETAMRESKDNWRESLLKNTVMLKELPGGTAPDRGRARELVVDFLARVAANDLGAALARVAWLDDPRGANRMLRNLGYEMTASRRSGHAPEPTGVFSGSHWTAVGVRMGGGPRAEHPFYPVVMTANGPRILLEVDLFVSRKRGRDFLNGAALDRLNDHAPPAVVDELRELFKAFETETEAANGGGGP